MRHTIFSVYIGCIWRQFMLKTSEFLYVKKFDNVKWDPGEMHIEMAIYSL